MSDVNLNVVVQPVETNITINSNELSVTPTAIDLTLSTTNAGAANIVFDVQPATSNLVITTNDISFTPSAVNMQMYGALGLPGGNTTTVQFNNGGQLGGIPNVKWDGSNLSLGNISNVKLSGGSANYVIKTDGNGNLSWGTPTIAGANTTVQYNNNGQLGGSTSFTFNNTSNTMSVTNIKVGAYYYANGQPLNLSNTYSNANVSAFLATSVFTGQTNDVKTTGVIYNFDGAVSSGRETFLPLNSANTGGSSSTIKGFSSDGTYMYGCDDTLGTIMRSNDGQNWSVVFTPPSGTFEWTATINTLIVAVGSTGTVAYSSNGTSWNTTPSGSFIQVIRFGSLFVAINSTQIYTSSNGISWTLRQSGTGFVDIAATNTQVVVITQTAGFYSSNATTWTAIAINTFTTAFAIQSNTTTFVVSNASFITGGQYRSTNGSTWTSFSPVAATTGTMFWDSSIGYWVYHYVNGTNGLPFPFDLITTDFATYFTRNVKYLPESPYLIVENFNVGLVNISRATNSTALQAVSLRKIPQNLIYNNIQTMASAATGNYRCLGPLSSDYTNSLYLWAAVT